jgi:cytochrome c
MKLMITRMALVLSSAALLAFSTAATAAVDEDAAKALAKKNDCFKCHAIDKTKKGPSYKKIAAKYKGKEAEGEQKMIKNMTTGPKVKLEDGSEEDHKIIETKDQAEIKNLIYWILSL